MLSAADALSGNTARYDGSLFDSAADFVAVDFRKSAQRDGFAYGEKTYSAETTDEKALVTDCIPLLSSKLDENYQTGGFIPVIDDSSIISELDSRNVNNYVFIRRGISYYFKKYLTKVHFSVIIALKIFLMKGSSFYPVVNIMLPFGFWSPSLIKVARPSAELNSVEGLFS